MGGETLRRAQIVASGIQTFAQLAANGVIPGLFLFLK